MRWSLAATSGIRERPLKTIGSRSFQGASWHNHLAVAGRSRGVGIRVGLDERDPDCCVQDSGLRNLGRVGLTLPRSARGYSALALVLTSVVLGSSLAGCSTASHASVATTPKSSTVQWAHPSAHAWWIEHRQDVATIQADEQGVYGDMICDPAISSCPPGTSLIADPGQWPENIISLACPPLTADVATVRTDGRVPSQVAQRQWTTALDDMEGGCAAIEAAMTAYRTAAQENQGYIPSVQQSASTAVVDIGASAVLLRRFDSYVDETR